MGLIKEFKEFAVKGNAIDLAVAVIIGAAFGKIISSVVADLLMPPIGLILGGVDFKTIIITLKEAAVDPATNAVIPAVTMNIGLFLQAVLDFLIIAFILFLIIKAINKLKKEEADVPPEPTKEELLLTEIRDILKEKK
ncbi:MAG: large-conductance mechanosensitive channel protein MscL [Ignavibacteria bacterium]|nr:large-conductance mechanosensitive channel protein MscL [Ignavibacteria bacterium]